MRKKFYCLSFFTLILSIYTFTGSCQSIRRDTELKDGWRTVIHDTDSAAYRGFEQAAFPTNHWQVVNVPHNWDDYGGYRNLQHGNRHGFAWYRKTFQVRTSRKNTRFFLFFEGVGSYATVYLNGHKIGYHAGGRTTFTLDGTSYLKKDGKPNLLAVYVDHHAGIRDLPWVCGGCSSERGFSEGSQPMGIFRPVHLVETSSVRIQPFGIHVWNDSSANRTQAALHLETEIKNYGREAAKVDIRYTLVNAKGMKVATANDKVSLRPGESIVRKSTGLDLTKVNLWSPQDPYLYRLVTAVYQNGALTDSVHTPYGIRTFRWVRNASPKAVNGLFINGKHFFINGTAEYEHLLGKGHAFSSRQVDARVKQIRSLGFNAFRDAHQPHNLRYQRYWDRLGMLWWPQMVSHIWYDTPAFRNNFKALLTDWIRERRNSPSVMLWGLANESAFPAEFARECSELIRSLDPTASSQRLITSCNGGDGTDWNVPQNWSGTYSGNPKAYAQDLVKQILVGEYGAWRTEALHAEGPFMIRPPYTEERISQLMEMKVAQAENVKDSIAGHFNWLWNSHDNPGRVDQNGEGMRAIDKIGPVNYKGLLTPWEQPLDVYYMYKSNFANVNTDPVVYIAMHTWPDRWTTPGIKDDIVVYSNCDAIELFNDGGKRSLGKRYKGSTGTHFRWDHADIRYNVLFARGYVKGKCVATDHVILHHLPVPPYTGALLSPDEQLLKPVKGLRYLYRVNCGGPDLQDAYGSLWVADRDRGMNKGWGSRSWGTRYKGSNPYQASQGVTNDLISGTMDMDLFRSFRYGRDQLDYTFPVPDGEYVIEMYFMEPWVGAGGATNASGLRLFDIAVNEKAVIHDLDIWKEAGHDHALKKTFKVRVRGGKLRIHFPWINAGQAIISAIAIASPAKTGWAPAAAAPTLITDVGKDASAETWLNTGMPIYRSANDAAVSLTPELYTAEWIKYQDAKRTLSSFSLTAAADLYLVTADSGRFEGLKDAGWKRIEGQKVTIRRNTGLQDRAVFRKKIESPGRVILPPGLSSENSFIAVTPPSVTDTMVKVKPLRTFTADLASVSGSIADRVVHGRKCLTFLSRDSASLTWPVSTGVGDIYTVHLHFYNPSSSTASIRLEWLTAEGLTLFKSQTIALLPSGPGSWSMVDAVTPGMINAGNYLIRITALNAPGLSINKIELQ